MSLRQRVRPGVSHRTDFPLDPMHAALLVIDIQAYLAEPPQQHNDQEAAAASYLFAAALPAAMPNITHLVRAFRKVRDYHNKSTAIASPLAQYSNNVGCEVLWTYLQSSTIDNRDVSLDYQLSGPLLAGLPNVVTSRDAIFTSACILPDLETGRGDVLVPKTSCNVFCSTNIDYVLRNLHVAQLVVCGQLTDQCVQTAVRSAADLGYFVTVVPDACAASSHAAHQRGLDGMRGFARIVPTEQVLHELQQA